MKTKEEKQKKFVTEFDINGEKVWWIYLCYNFFRS